MSASDLAAVSLAPLSAKRFVSVAEEKSKLLASLSARSVRASALSLTWARSASRSADSRCKDCDY